MSTALVDIVGKEKNWRAIFCLLWRRVGCRHLFLSLTKVCYENLLQLENTHHNAGISGKSLERGSYPVPPGSMPRTETLDILPVNELELGDLFLITQYVLDI